MICCKYIMGYGDYLSEEKSMITNRHAAYSADCYIGGIL